MMSLVAPSPSLAIARASSWATWVKLDSSCSASTLPARIGSLPAAPLASIRKLSLVELSPSTVTWLKLRSAIDLTRRAISPASTAASVVM